MRIQNLVILGAVGIADAQTDAPELTRTQYDSIFEVDFAGAEDAPEQVVSNREAYTPPTDDDSLNGNNRAVRPNRKQTRFGGRPIGVFRGPPGAMNPSLMGGFGRGLGRADDSMAAVLGPGGRLGGFGSGAQRPTPVQDSETEEQSFDDIDVGDDPTTTMEPVTLTKAEPTTEPSSLFEELRDFNANKVVTETTEQPTQPPVTSRSFWEKKEDYKLVDTPFSERSRQRFIDTITKTMNIPSRGMGNNRCLECKNAPDPMTCLSEGHVKQCTKNEACQTEIRFENGRVRIESFCKQMNACKVMLSQNGQCNRLKGKKGNRTCWKCCTGDLCNIGDMAPHNFV